MRPALLLLLLCALSGPASAKKRPAKVDPKAQEVFDRTKKVQATYAIYNWSWRRGYDGRISLHWSAEFHQGSKHRIENPDLRAVADCSTGEAAVLEPGGELIGNHAWMGDAICGIRSDKLVRRMEWVGRKDSRFGPLDTIRLIGFQEERIYTVDSTGILVATETFPTVSGLKSCVQTEPLAIEAELPAADIFSVASLIQSAVPEKYRTGPEAPVGDLWSGTRRCI